jgi:hypothetical protein
MIAIGLLFVRMLCDYFKSRPQLEAEIVILRHQLNLLQRRAPRRPHLRWVDRALFIWLYRRCPRVLRAITIVRPETVLRWHRMGFAAYWRWKSRSPGGRPRIAQEVRDLIRRMSLENPLWGATKIHGELLKVGIEVAQSIVSIYMVPRSDRPMQTWKIFLSNHTEGVASIDLFVVPTIAFQRLFAFLVLGHERRRLLWFAVTAIRRPTGWRARSRKRFMGRRPKISHSRQRQSVRRYVQSSCTSNGDPGQTHVIPFPYPVLGGLHHRMLESSFRKRHRFLFKRNSPQASLIACRTRHETSSAAVC